ncbi:hypothetical protein, partial [Novipirellula maiorica]|uniref:hypothetical protein n=1 Tax=Novipirellula maiorica TaxID=1265734 RepID=UPI001F1ECEA5
QQQAGATRRVARRIDSRSDSENCVFSEWRRMLDRVQRRLDQIGCDYVRLDGQVPRKNGLELWPNFKTIPSAV